MVLRVRATGLWGVLVLWSVLATSLPPLPAMANHGAAPAAALADTAAAASTGPGSGSAAAPKPLSGGLLGPPLSFERNVGQTDRRVSFLSRGPGYLLFVTGSDAVLNLMQDRTPGPLPDHPVAGDGLLTPTTAISGDVLQIHYVGANAAPQSAAQEPLPGTVNYLIGRNPQQWHTGLPTYGRVTLHDLYPGIDLAYYGTQGHLEDDFVVGPGRDPGAIAFTVSGVQGLHLDAQGNLVLRTALGDMQWSKPAAYQQNAGHRRAVPIQYALTGGQVRFTVGSHDRSHPLVIDPVLAYATYLGGRTGDDQAGWLAIDGFGNVYATGETLSTDFPTTTGAYSTSNAGSYDAVVTKLNPAGTAALYSTYLGGSGDEYGNAIAIDGAGDAYLTGRTYSANFPLANAAQSIFGGTTTPPAGELDAFVTKLNPTGTALLYSTYLGGAYADMGAAIAVDAAGNAYVTGDTQSISANVPYPTTANAFQAGNAGLTDAFVTEVNTRASGTASLVYSSYLGGGDNDYGRGIAVDGSGRIYVSGYTGSPAGTTSPFPTTASAYATTNAGSTDLFVTKLDLRASPTQQLLYSTYLGGSADDYGYRLAVDQAGLIYLAGQAGSSDFPTAHALQPQKGASYDSIVVKLNPALSRSQQLVYSTYLGGNGGDGGFGITVDGVGNAYVAGDTISTDFITTTTAVQPTYGGGAVDAFVTELNPTGSAVLFSTYLGGSDHDYAVGIGLDSAGAMYVTGHTNSVDFPSTPAAVQPSNAGGPTLYDEFVAKIAPPTSGTVPCIPTRTCASPTG